MRRSVLTLPLLVLALASPSPQPAPTNPFNLNPVPRATSLPIIGTTRTKPVCTAIRRGVKPALASAMQNDVIYGGTRKRIFDYIAKESDDTRDLRLMQMDAKVNDLVKSTDALEEALKDSTFVPGPKVRPEDAKTLKDLHDSLAGVLAAQRIQLDALSGFVETERARRYGKLDESQQAMIGSTAVGPNPNTMATIAPMTGFLREQQDIFSDLKHPYPTGLNGATHIDRDLGDIAAFTAKREVVANRTIIAAVAACK
jgi:hypothetical protein